MNPEPMAYESTAPPLSYLATMPKDITRNRLKSQPIFPTQILLIGTTQERSLRPELAILDFFRSPRRCAPRDDRFVVGKGLDPLRNAYGTAHPIRFATKAGAAPQDKITNGTVRDRSLRQTSSAMHTERCTLSASPPRQAPLLWTKSQTERRETVPYGRPPPQCIRNGARYPLRHQGRGRSFGQNHKRNGARPFPTANICQFTV